LQTFPRLGVSEGKSLMEQSKKHLSSPFLQTRLPAPHAAGDRIGAAWHSRGSPRRSAGVRTGTPANRRYCCAPTRLAPTPDFLGNRRHCAAWRAASAAAGSAGNLHRRNTSDRELAGTAEMPCRKRHTAAPPSSMRLRPADLNEVRYRLPVTGSVTTFSTRRKHR
jgi:hypothetical protein